MSKYLPQEIWNECPVGWVSTVEQLLSELENVCGWKHAYVTQIKSKLGALCFYYDRDLLPPDQWAAVDFKITAYRVRSYTVCELCGAAANSTRSAGYSETRCLEHRQRIHES